MSQLDYFCFLISTSSAFNILFIPPIISRSHKLAMLPWADKLAENGHNVVIWEPVAQGNHHRAKIAKNDYFEVTISNEYLMQLRKDNEDSVFHKLLWTTDVNLPFIESQLTALSSPFCKEVFVSYGEQLANLLKTPWDLVILDELFNTCGFAVAAILKDKYGSSIALYNSNSRLSATSASYANIPTPLAYFTPLGDMSGLTDKMTFFQRVRGTLSHYLRLLGMDLSFFFQRMILREDLSQYGITVSQDLRSGTMRPDLVFGAFLNELDFPSPITRQLVPIGGINLNLGEAGKGLDPQLEKVIMAHPAGFGVISMGHVASWSAAPPAVLEAFREALNRLPEDFLVLFQSKQGFPGGGLNPNIQLHKWLPMISLLNRPELGFFLTHGGANSVAEAASVGAPMAVLALFADQIDSAVRIRCHGLGRIIFKTNLTADAISETINSLRNNPSYKENARKFAERLGDIARFSLERAVFRTEWLLHARQRNPSLYKKFLKTEVLFTRPGLFHAIRYHCIDVCALLLFFGALILLIIGYLSKKIYDCMIKSRYN